MCYDPLKFILCFSGLFPFTSNKLSTRYTLGLVLLRAQAQIRLTPNSKSAHPPPAQSWLVHTSSKLAHPHQLKAGSSTPNSKPCHPPPTQSRLIHPSTQSQLLIHPSDSKQARKWWQVAGVPLAICHLAHPPPLKATSSSLLST